MSPRPKIVDVLGRELVRAARESEARERGRRPRLLSRLPRTFVLGLLALLGLAAVAAAASLIIGRGDPIPAAAPVDVPLELRPVAGSARLNGLDVADPDGGPVWDVRTSRSKTGAICATVGQVLDGELGLLGLDRRFRALPAGAADTCSTPRRHGATLAGARAFRGGGSLSALTVVNGVAAPGVRRVLAVAGGRSVPLRLGPGRAFLAVFRGLPEAVRPRVVLTEATGRTTSLRFADDGEFIAPDPSGGAPWSLRHGPPRAGLRCVSAQRERGSDSPGRTTLPAFDLIPPTTPTRCAPAARGGVMIARFVPSVRMRGGGPLWGTSPARTIAWGIAPPGATSVVLTGAGAPRRVPVDPRGRGFLAVLGGRVDPRVLRVSAAGRRLRPAVSRRGRPLARRTPPRWRSVASVLAGPRPSFLPRRPPILTRSVVTARRAEDPTGGPPWALRTWREAAAPARSSRPSTCWGIGIERGGRLAQPVAGDRYAIVGESRVASACPNHRVNRAVAPLVRTYVDDPDATTPRPARVVVAGMLGDGVRSAVLLGAGAPRPLSLGRHGTFLLVLGPEHAGADLRVRQTRDDGRVLTSPSGGVISDRCRARPGSTMRVADPDGRQPWTTGVGRVAPPGPISGMACQYVGRLAGERLATVLDGETWMYYGAGFAAGTRNALGRRSLTLTVQGGGGQVVISGAGARAARPSPAQVARRTLPGRTVLSGQVSRDVVALTLRTPRDIRTLRPTPGGAYIAVYDGEFYGGEVSATARLRGGRQVTLTRPASGF